MSDQLPAIMQRAIKDRINDLVRLMVDDGIVVDGATPPDAVTVLALAALVAAGMEKLDIASIETAGARYKFRFEKAAL